MPEQTLAPIRKRKMPVALRIILYLIAFFVGTGLIQYLGILVSGISLEELGASNKMDTGTHLILGLWGLIPLVFFTYIFRKYMDGKSIMSLGFSVKGRGTDFLAGLLVAVVIIVIGSLILQFLAYVEIKEHSAGFSVMALNLLLFLLVSISEEVAIRGYVLNNLLTVMNRYAALGISALIFALMHGVNPNLTWLAMLNLFLAGIVLGAAYIFTQNLWFPVSLHLFWNYFQGPVLGYNVSGQTTDSLFLASPQGNPILSGGEFGFEGSIVCTFLIILVSLGILAYYEQKKKRMQI